MRQPPVDPRNSPETNAWVETYWRQLFPPAPPVLPLLLAAFVLAWFAVGAGLAFGHLVR
jgi:hypothetical protein